MNKRGFTLIELLAVIVILAIIALIATPIVLSIINQSKESAQLRSAEMYLKGVETSVASSIIHEKNVDDGTHPITKDGDVCLGTLQGSGETATCNGEELKVEMNGEKPSSGTVTIASGKVKDIAFTYSNKKTIVMNEGKLVYGEKGNVILSGKLDDVCKYDSANGVAAKTAGAKYSCEVKPGTSYTFYVLTTPKEGDTSINLIMDANINSSGEAVIPGVTKDTGLVAWNSESGQSTPAHGPVTAMTYLYNATKDWTNIAPVNYTYNDKDVQRYYNVYISFVSNNGVATITQLSGNRVTIGSETTPLRTRMPIYSMIIVDDAPIETGEVIIDTYASYLYDNLDSNGNAVPYGYWTLSSANTADVWSAYYNGSVAIYGCVNGSTIGVRPVITLEM